MMKQSLAQHVLQDASLPVILYFGRGIKAHQKHDFFTGTVGSGKLKTLTMLRAIV